MHEPGDWVPSEWLGGETSVEKVETEFQYLNEQLRAEWRSFISQMQLGDQLRSFCSPADSWLYLAGRAGYAIVRQGKVVDAIVTLLN